MSQAKLPTYAVRRQFVDFDELAEETRQWDLDLRQMDRGKFHGELLQFGLSGAHVSEARFGRALVQKGTPPIGLRTIAVPANQNVQFSWRGQPVSGQDLVIFPSGADLSCVSTPDFHIYTCSFPENMLASISDAISLGELDDLSEGEGVVRCRMAAIRSVRKCLHKLCNAIRDGRLALTNQELVDHATGDLPMRLLSTISTAHRGSSPRITRKREMALVRAETYVEQFAQENISVRDICHAAQVSQRTLEYAFFERFGMTPKAFLIAHKLNAARRELRSADATKENVATIANRWGFWHLGQFAADYREQFDELPSQTLRRNG